MMTLELEPHDLVGLLSNSLTIVREKASDRGVRLELNIPTPFEPMLLDVRKTKQIVYNLLANAVKFSGQNELVTLSAVRVRRPAVGVFLEGWPKQTFDLPDTPYQEFLEISVLDKGIGLAPEDLGRLFQAFTQVESGLSRRFEGTGLGLAMVKQLAELHGGTVAATSLPQQGARFSVWLPLRQALESDVLEAEMLH